jgi:carbamoyl-phosphate synthase large subunit
MIIVDKLDIEELSIERVMDVNQYEGAGGVIISVDGRIANNFAVLLAEKGVHILGTSAKNIEELKIL